MATPEVQAQNAASGEDKPEEVQSDGNKLKTFIMILKKFIGVADLAAVRFSLPSQLLEPTPNLEYWNYLDTPNAFIAIGTSDEPLDRMLEVCRFWFSKDLKYAKGRPCKPYNSCLGEFFRCNFETENNAPLISTAALKGGSSSSSKRRSAATSSAGSSSVASSIKSAKDDTTAQSQSPSTVSLSVPKHDAEPRPEHLVRVSFLTEQTSHHPPVSAFYISCPERGLAARGFDHITAKFTGTTIKVQPGEHNLGIFVDVKRPEGEGGDETYQLTHPAAHVGGILRGSLSVSISETTYISCVKTKIKTILNYVDEGGWLGRAINKVEGVVFRYDPAKDDKVRIRDVPDEDVLARLSGPWKEKVILTLGPKPVSAHRPEAQFTIIDVGPLEVAPKIVPPLDRQLPHESRALWGGVTDAIHAKQFSRATTVKQELEENQRVKAREREAKGEKWQPVFFHQVTGNGGRPELTEKGQEVLKRAQKGEWNIDGVLE